MLENNDFKLLDTLSEIVTDDGQFSVIEKADVLDKMSAMNVTELDAAIEKLELHEMIAVRYTDADVYCLMFKPKGRLACEKRNAAPKTAVAATTTAAATFGTTFSDVSVHEETEDEVLKTEEVIEAPKKAGRLANMSQKWFIIFCGLSAFAGGMLAAIVSFLIAKFA